MFKKNRYTLTILLLITIIGTILRLYKFPNFPDFTDEVRESLTAYSLYTFESLPLTSFSKYIGPLHGYFIVLIMWVLGPHVWLPRLVALIIGISTIPLAYIFGKEYYNKHVGLLTALYVAISPTLILINSRIAWATCMTPFFTLALYIYIKRFENNPNIKYSVVVGSLFAILLNLHPLMLPFIIPLIIYFIWITIRKTSPISTKVKLIFIGFFSTTVFMLPLIIANIQTPLVSLKGAIEQDNISQDKLDFSFKTYTKDLDRLIAQTEHVINRSIIFDGHVIPEYLYKPIYVISSVKSFPFFILLISSVIIVLKKEYKMLPILTSIGSLIFFAPLITSNYFEGLTVRYFSSLIPLFGLVISYGVYSLYSLKNNFLIRLFSFFIILVVMLYIPLHNLNLFTNKISDLSMNITKDIHYLNKLKEDNYTINYVDDVKRDSNKEYAIVEYLVKFNRNKNTNTVNKNLVLDDNNILILPKKIEEIIDEPLLKLVKNNEVTLVYEGTKILVYK